MKVQKLDYKPVEDQDNPFDRYTRAKQEYTDDVGQAKKEAFHWRMLAVVILLLLGGSIAGNIYLSNKNTITPYMIEIDKQSGVVMSVNKVTKAEFKPGDLSIKHKISRFIKNIRSISTDPIVVRGNYQSAYKMVTRRCRDIFITYRDQFKPKSKIGKKAISVDNMIITKITNHSFQAEWLENEFTIGTVNAKAGLKRYTGTFTIKVLKVKNEEQLKDNPLGIYIDEFHITNKY